MSINVDPDLLRDPGWRAALHIITSPTFRSNDARLWSHVDLGGRSIFFADIIKEGTWSSTEALMLRAAWSLFNQDCDINLWNLVNRISDDQAVTLLDAIACAAFSRYIPKPGLLHQRKPRPENVPPADPPEPQKQKT
jgi:hypothetical protein